MKNIKASLWFKGSVISFFVLVALLLSFSGNSFAAEYVALKMYPEHVGVFIEDGEQQFVAFGIRADGSSANITSQVGWESSNENIVIIDDNGLATVVGSVTSGQVEITCSYPKIGKGLPAVHLLLKQ